MKATDFIGMNGDLQATIFTEVSEQMVDFSDAHMERLMDAIHEETVRALLENMTMCARCGADPDMSKFSDDLKRATCPCGNKQMTGA